MIIDGKQVAADRREALAAKVAKFDKKLGLGIIVATDNPATHTYIASKLKAAEAVGYSATVRELPPSATQNEVVAACHEFNDNDEITGYIVQLPLPDAVDKLAAFSAVDPAKDADGLTPTNLGFLYTNAERIIPATPKGILSLLEAYDVDPAGKNVTVVGKGLLTGLPMATLLSHRGATVTSCDKKTRDLAAHTREADILVVAAGKPGLITGDMVKEGVVVIDIGVTKLEERVTGDVDFESVEPKAAAITPVPGGVGPMTVASLLENVYELSQLAG